MQTRYAPFISPGLILDMNTVYLLSECKMFTSLVFFFS